MFYFIFYIIKTMLEMIEIISRLNLELVTLHFTTLCMCYVCWFVMRLFGMRFFVCFCIYKMRDGNFMEMEFVVGFLNSLRWINPIQHLQHLQHLRHCRPMVASHCLRSYCSHRHLCLHVAKCCHLSSRNSVISNKLKNMDYIHMGDYLKLPGQPTPPLGAPPLILITC